STAPLTGPRGVGSRGSSCGCSMCREYPDGPRTPLPAWQAAAGGYPSVVRGGDAQGQGFGAGRLLLVEAGDLRPPGRTVLDMAQEHPLTQGPGTDRHRPQPG